MHVQRFLGEFAKDGVEIDTFLSSRPLQEIGTFYFKPEQACSYFLLTRARITLFETFASANYAVMYGK